MTNILILGAGGQIARHVVEQLAGDKEIRQTLFLRSPRKLGRDLPMNATVVKGDVLNESQLSAAMAGQTLVYANLTGADLAEQADAVIAAMREAGVRRLVFVLALGIYDEVPGRFGAWNTAMIGEDLKPFRRAGDLIEASGLDYTIIRPALLMDEDQIDYEVTARDQPFRGTVVSRRSVADLIARIIASPDLHVRANLGVNKPNTDADKPYFM